MRRLWTAAALLALLAVLLLAGGRALEDLSAPILEDLPQAVQAARAGDWTQAQALTERARTQWAGGERWLPMLESHQLAGEVESLLEETAVWARCRDLGALETAAGRACRTLTAMAAAERPSLGNLL